MDLQSEVEESVHSYSQIETEKFTFIKVDNIKIEPGISSEVCIKEEIKEESNIVNQGPPMEEIKHETTEDYAHICEKSENICKDPKGLRVCEGDTMNLECPSGQRISILAANYGRTLPGHQVCPKPGIDINVNCKAASSLQTIMKKCNGHEKCSIEATNHNFGDPCVGTYKYLDVRYECIKNIQVVTTCEHDDLNIRCPSKERINIISADYGRTQPGSKVCPQKHIDENVHCISDKSLGLVMSRCNGRTNCNVPAENSVFDDPCPGTYKYLHVRYVCVKDLTFENICEGHSQVIHCPDDKFINIIGGNYGRSLPGDKVCPAEGADQYTNCFSEDSVYRLRNNCNLQRSCSLSATNGFFGDPCFGTYKYLDVSYSCIHHQV